MDNEKNYDSLKLCNQLCFPLYACSKEIVKKYRDFLDPLGLTYTQYITMMVMWERKQVGVKELGEALYLDSGTLTPLLKKLEKQGFVSRSRSTVDERNLIVSITDKGEALREKAVAIPEQIGQCLNLDSKETETLYQLLYKVLRQVKGGSQKK